MSGQEASGSSWEAALERLADESARARDVGLSLLSDHVVATVEVIRSRAAEHGNDDVDARIGEALTAIRADVAAQLDRIEASVRAERR